MKAISTSTSFLRRQPSRKPTTVSQADIIASPTPFHLLSLAASPHQPPPSPPLPKTLQPATMSHLTHQTSTSPSPGYPTPNTAMSSPPPSSEPCNESSEQQHHSAAPGGPKPKRTRILLSCATCRASKLKCTPPLPFPRALLTRPKCHRRPHPTMQPMPQKGPGVIMHVRAQARAPGGRAAEHDGAAEAVGGDGAGDDGRRRGR